MIISLTVGLTGKDWEPTNATRYYAQANDDGEFAFGSTAKEAENNLRKRLLDLKAERLTRLFTPSIHQ